MVRIRHLALLILLVLPGCVTASAGSREMAAVAPMLSVERFLQAVNSQDLDAMARIFGTYDGPIADTGGTLGCAFRRMGSWIGFSRRCLTRVDVELRMNAIAIVLRHEDYQLVSERPVPGRQRPTSRVGVTLVRQGQQIPDVPFVVVQSRNGRWLIEQIDLERVTRSE